MKRVKLNNPCEQVFENRKSLLYCIYVQLL